MVVNSIQVVDRVVIMVNKLVINLFANCDWALISHSTTDLIHGLLIILNNLHSLKDCHC